MSEDPTPYTVYKGPVFFPVSRLKLVVMSVVTFGLYQMFWFYKNWRIVKLQTSTRIMPFWRAFFGYFFCYSLFILIRRVAVRQGIKPMLSPGMAFLLWVALSSLGKLRNGYSLGSELAVLPLLAVQNTIDRLNAAAGGDYNRNSKFTAWNWAAILIGGPLFALSCWTTFHPEILAD